MCVENSKGLKLAIPYHDPIVTGDPFVVPRPKWIGFQELGFDWRDVTAQFFFEYINEKKIEKAFQ